jgi:CrcB protein
VGVFFCARTAGSGGVTVNRFLWICLGGAAGTGARYLLGGWVLGVFGSLLPFETLAVNVIGSFLISAIMHVALATRAVSPTLRLVLTTGFLGGFTTYSSFNYETVKLAQDGAFSIAALYVAVMLLGCLVAGFAGFWVGRLVVGG